MTTKVETLPVHATMGDARRLFGAGGHGAYPLVDDAGACAGIVSRNDLLVRDLPDAAPVKDVATTDVLTVEPDDSLLTVLERMTEDGVDHVPVVEHDRLVGICTARTCCARGAATSSTSDLSPAGDRNCGGRTARTNASRPDVQPVAPTGCPSTIWSRYSDSPKPTLPSQRHSVMPSEMRVTSMSPSGVWRRFRSGMSDSTLPSIS